MPIAPMAEKTYDTIVVGAGMAGLTATAYLARSGQKVLLLEKNAEVGGLVSSFSRDGFRFDAGVRALEDAGIILPLLRDLNIKLDTVKSPVTLGIEDEILRIENVGSLADYQALLKKFYPDSEAEIDKLVMTIRKIMKYMDVLYGIENPVFMDLKRDTRYLFKKLLPWLPRFLLTVGKINRMRYPVEEYLNAVIRDQSLRDIISQHFFQRTPTFFALSYFSLYLDYFYPHGGVGKLAEAVQDKIVEFAGEINTEKAVVAMSPAHKTLTDQAGNLYEYRNLIWAADLKTLYRMASSQNLTAEVQTKFERVKAQMLRNKGGESVFTLFLEVDEPLESFARIATGHFFFTPSRQGLGETHRRELQDLLRDFPAKSKQEILDWLDRFISLNTYEISIPGLKDQDTVPPGKTGLIISFLAHYELFRKIEEAGWHEEFVSGIEDRMLKVISENVYPMLKDKVISRFSYSPLSIQHRIGSSEGAIVGWEFQAEMPVVNKIQIAGRSVLTPLPNIYQAGQWAYSPAGVPMSILTGKLAANRIIKAKK